MSETATPEAGTTRGMLPSTWAGREVRVRYQDDPSGKARDITSPLLGSCGLGVIVFVGGDRACIPWEALRLVTLTGA